MKLIPTESWDNELFEIIEILCILSMCLMWKGMKSKEQFSYLEFLVGNFKHSFYFYESITINIIVCVYNLCLTLSMGNKWLSGKGTCLRK